MLLFCREHGGYTGCDYEDEEDQVEDIMQRFAAVKLDDLPERDGMWSDTYSPGFTHYTGTPPHLRRNFNGWAMTDQPYDKVLGQDLTHCLQHVSMAISSSPTTVHFMHFVIVIQEGHRYTATTIIIHWTTLIFTANVIFSCKFPDWIKIKNILKNTCLIFCRWSRRGRTWCKSGSTTRRPWMARRTVTGQTLHQEKNIQGSSIYVWLSDISLQGPIIYVQLADISLQGPIIYVQLSDISLQGPIIYVE